MRKFMLAGTLAVVGCDDGPREADFHAPHPPAAEAIRIELRLCKFLARPETRGYAEQLVHCMTRRGYRYERRR